MVERPNQAVQPDQRRPATGIPAGAAGGDRGVRYAVELVWCYDERTNRAAEQAIF